MLKKSSRDLLSDTPKKTFGKYEAISHLGSGAMGVVWRAQDPVLGRTVAIKTISASLGSDNENKERFLREARAAAQLNHPNIITVFDFGQADNELYMAMELLEGKDLKELITLAQLTFDQGIINETTARGLFVLLNAIARGTAVSKSASERMVEVLAAQKFNDGIPRGLPPGTKVAHKTGTITRVHHDAAIVYGSRPCVLVVLTRGIEKEADSDALIARITRALVP